jgi:hypothetical protein
MKLTNLTIIMACLLAHSVTAQTVRPTGTFILGAQTSVNCPSGFTCYPFTTSVPDVLPTKAAGNGNIAIMRPIGTPVELDMFFPGAGGKWWTDPDTTLTMPMMQNLVSAGHIVVQLQWSGNIWYTSSKGEVAGLHRLSARPATVIKWVHDNWLPLGMSLKITGTSAGAGAIMYSLVYYGLDSIVAEAIPASLPFALIKQGCESNSANDPLANSGAVIIDCGNGFYGSTAIGPCYTENPLGEASWDSEDIVVTGINFYFPNTKVRLIYGKLDQSGILDRENAVNSKLSASDTDSTITTLPTMGHELQKSTEGVNWLQNELLSGQQPQSTPTPTATPTPCTCGP